MRCLVPARARTLAEFASLQTRKSGKSTKGPAMREKKALLILPLNEPGFFPCQRHHTTPLVLWLASLKCCCLLPPPTPPPPPSHKHGQKGKHYLNSTPPLPMLLLSWQANGEILKSFFFPFSPLRHGSVPLPPPPRERERKRTKEGRTYEVWEWILRGRRRTRNCQRF